MPYITTVWLLQATYHHSLVAASHISPQFGCCTPHITTVWLLYAAYHLSLAEGCHISPKFGCCTPHITIVWLQYAAYLHSLVAARHVSPQFGCSTSRVSTGWLLYAIYHHSLVAVRHILPPANLCITVGSSIAGLSPNTHLTYLSMVAASICGSASTSACFISSTTTWLEHGQHRLADNDIIHQSPVHVVNWDLHTHNYTHTITHTQIHAQIYIYMIH